MSYQPKVALVHDDFMQAGGAESLFATIASLYPDAPIYTSLVDWQKIPQSIDPKRIKTSFMQNIPIAKNFFKALLPLYPLAFESFNFNDFDLVISSTTRFAKGIITKPKTIHISYTNSIPRFLWDDVTLKEYLSSEAQIATKPAIKWLRRWDRASAQSVDAYIANSNNVALKINEVYRREAKVVYPFANTNYYTPAKIHSWPLKSQSYYLIVTRLARWKKVDIAIEAFKKLKFNLKIAGTGPDLDRLETLANGAPNIQFLGKVTQSELRELYRNSKGTIVTQQEDFGIATVESLSCGTIAIAYEKGGAAEIVENGRSGLFFKAQGAKSLKDAIEASTRIKWNVQTIRKSALKFTRSVFVAEFQKTINEGCQKTVI